MIHVAKQRVEVKLSVIVPKAILPDLDIVAAPASAPLVGLFFKARVHGAPGPQHAANGVQLPPVGLSWVLLQLWPTILQHVASYPGYAAPSYAC